jgi:hypothetical protein
VENAILVPWETGCLAGLSSSLTLVPDCRRTVGVPAMPTLVPDVRLTVGELATLMFGVPVMLTLVVPCAAVGTGWEVVFTTVTDEGAGALQLVNGVIYARVPIRITDPAATTRYVLSLFTWNLLAMQLRHCTSRGRRPPR